MAARVSGAAAAFRKPPLWPQPEGPEIGQIEQTFVDVRDRFAKFNTQIGAWRQPDAGMTIANE